VEEGEEQAQGAEGRPSTSAVRPKLVLRDGAGGVEGLGTNEDGEAEVSAVAPCGEGFVVRPSKYRDMQVARVGKRKLFDRKRRKVFLEWFAATGNCTFAAAKAGVHYRTIWKHRMKDEAFREAFNLAMEQGIARAQARLIEDKARGPIAVDGDLDDALLEPADPEVVLNLVARLEGAKAGVPARRQRTTARIASNAEVKKALAKRIAVFARRQRAMGRAAGGGSGGGEGGGGEEAPPPHCVRSPSPANAGED
jgi:hypothetical protein